MTDAPVLRAVPNAPQPYPPTDVDPCWCGRTDPTPHLFGVESHGPTPLEEPMTRLECCRPTTYSGGGGPIVHSQRCPVAPERPLSAAELAVWAGHPAGADREPEKDQHVLLASPGARYSLTRWLFHEPGCGCSDCAYVEAHLDDGPRR